jgi:hypothetical protein
MCHLKKYSIIWIVVSCSVTGLQGSHCFKRGIVLVDFLLFIKLIQLVA